MSRRDSEDNPATKSGGAPPPRRDADPDVDHARLAQLAAANYTPPAPLLPSTQLDARPAAPPFSSKAAAPPPQPPAGFDATLSYIPASDERRFDSAPVEAAAPLPPPQYAYAAPQSYAPMAPPRARAKSPLACAGLAALALVLLVGGVALILGSMRWFRSATPPGVNTNAPPRPVTTNAPPSAMPSQVFIPGGTFRMGRDLVGEELLNESGDRVGDELLYESPAHEVAVKPFMIDRTEVTNAEYAEFVRATGHPPPSDSRQGEQETPYWKPWSGTSPPAGQERWPVRNVTLADAEAFAGWRSKRDGVAYRLPTEEEWEYAARSGGAHRLYPWGDEFVEDRAVLNTALPQPVGSRPRGASREGVLDLIGNVWERTSSDAAVYPGNSQVTIDRKWKAVRGGSYQSKARGAAAVTATSRVFISPEIKHPTLGFRLARDARNR